MSKSKDKGTRFESAVVAHLKQSLGDGIERRCLHGTSDLGDISGVFFMGEPVVIECKNHAKMELASWCDEAEREAGNADAPYWVVVHKRKGCGEAAFGGNYVTMTLDVFERMISLGVR